MIRTPGHFSPQILQVQKFIVIILEHLVLTNVPRAVEVQLGDYHQEISHIDFLALIEYTNYKSYFANITFCED